MVPVAKTKPSIQSSSSFATETKTITEYSNTGFGQLPVPKTRTRLITSFRPSRVQYTLILTAFVLSLSGVIYLLLYVTITFTKS